MRKQRSQFAISQRRGNGQQSGDNPRQQQPTGRTGDTGDVGSHNEDARADHRANHDHGSIEQSDGANEAGFLFFFFLNSRKR
jgi:hypothetical protein